MRNRSSRPASAQLRAVVSAPLAARCASASSRVRLEPGRHDLVTCSRLAGYPVTAVRYALRCTTHTCRQKTHRHGRDLRPPSAQPEYVLFSEDLYRSGGRLRPTTRYKRSRRTSRESDPCAPTLWRSGTSPGPSLRHLIPPCSSASAARLASSAEAHVVALPLTDTSAASHSSSARLWQPGLVGRLGRPCGQQRVPVDDGGGDVHELAVRGSRLVA